MTAFKNSVLPLRFVPATDISHSLASKAQRPNRERVSFMHARASRVRYANCTMHKTGAMQFDFDPSILKYA